MLDSVSCEYVDALLRAILHVDKIVGEAAFRGLLTDHACWKRNLNGDEFVGCEIPALLITFHEGSGGHQKP